MPVRLYQSQHNQIISKKKKKNQTCALFLELRYAFAETAVAEQRIQ